MCAHTLSRSFSRAASPCPASACVSMCARPNTQQGIRSTPVYASHVTQGRVRIHITLRYRQGVGFMGGQACDCVTALLQSVMKIAKCKLRHIKRCFHPTRPICHWVETAKAEIQLPKPYFCAVTPSVKCVD